MAVGHALGAGLRKKAVDRRQNAAILLVQVGHSAAKQPFAHWHSTRLAAAGGGGCLGGIFLPFVFLNKKAHMSPSCGHNLLHIS